MWYDIEGHDEMVTRFARALARGRLASTFLFVGSDGIGKKMFAKRLAQTLQCERSTPEKMAPCGECSCCRQALEGTHPDILYVRKPDDRATIPIDLLIGPKEDRMNSGLCSDLAKTPYYGRRKIAIIDDADFLSIDDGNAMLKTLEEPPKNSVLILIGTSLAKQLPTVRSRCQVMRFTPLATETVERILNARLEQELEQARAAMPKRSKKTPTGSFSPEMIPTLAAYSNGSVSEALALSDPGLWDFRRSFLSALADGPLERILLQKSIEAQLDSVGKVPALRRARLRVIMEIGADYYRRLALYLTGTTDPNPRIHAEWEPVLKKAAARWKLDVELAAMTALNTVEKIELLKRNVNQTLLLEAWLDQILRLAGGDATAVNLDVTEG